VRPHACSYTGVISIARGFAHRRSDDGTFDSEYGLCESNARRPAQLTIALACIYRICLIPADRVSRMYQFQFFRLTDDSIYLIYVIKTLFYNKFKRIKDIMYVKRHFERTSKLVNTCDGQRAKNVKIHKYIKLSYYF